MTKRIAGLANGTATRSILLRGGSVAVVAAILAASPAHAQLAARRGPTLTAPTVAPRAVPGEIRTRAQTDALNRAGQVRSRVDQIRTYATQARAAAAAARSVPDGTQGLVVARGVTAEALASGALQAARDASGRATWQGAGLPGETTENGRVIVTINQTESRAILSWDRFDVGANTTLRFNQSLNGTAQRDWVAVNRVVDPNAAPSQILGRITAPGTVLVLNRNGVLFGAGSQVNTHSLLASTLDIGNFLRAGNRVNPLNNQVETGLVGTTLQDRNIGFLQNGLLQDGPSQQGITLAGTLTSALVSGFFTPSVSAIETALAGGNEGEITVERGASITAGTGGFVILTGPRVTNDGRLVAEQGQVSLQAGRAITATPSTGAAGSADPNVRGLILRSSFGAAGGRVVNSGLIETRRGYASLGAGLLGSVTNAGLIAATTSVSRNGAISLTAGTVTLAGADNAGEASGLVITPDDNGETVPQGTAADPAAFKRSQIEIGAVYLDPGQGETSPLGETGPGAITIGRNALIHAPNANVEIGGAAGEVFSPSRFVTSPVPDALATLAASRITIESGALIDVSGVKDLELSAGRNSLMIDPVKRNELRDTPNYRETNTTGEFTLNGSTVFVDPRITGVRDDGVAWTGSPLIEAGSAASQIGVSAAELMTEGGTVNLNVSILEGAQTVEAAPRVTIAEGATIDFSGGWVKYLPGIVRTSRLLTADGRVVDIASADPNDRFVAIGDGFTEVQAAFGISRTYANSILQGARFEAGYDEGRDAGALIVSASAATLGGTLHGDAFAGLRQLTGAARPAGLSTLAGDPRRVQTWANQLPAGGLLRIGAADRANLTEQTADIVIGRAGTAAPQGAIVLNSDMLNAAGLGALSLRTTAGVSLAAGSDLRLANGGTLAIVAGRAVDLAGNITAPSGAITVTTQDFGRDIFGASLGSIGSPFRADDDLTGHYLADPALRPFDITVSGRLSTAGLWINDYLDSASFGGSAWKDGGSISLAVAPRVFVGLGGTPTAPERAIDLSGSIRIADSAMLDVSAGGYVASDGGLELDGQGGDIALINRTRYAAATLTDTNTDNTARGGLALGGTNQTVQFTPYAVGDTMVAPALVPDEQIAEVVFNTASLRGFGFAGGGTFTLVAPDIALGSQAGGKGPQIGLDFLQRTGFGTLDLTANKSRFIENLFANGRGGLSAFLDTERFVIGAGETLDLTQWVLPSLIDAETIGQLTSLGSGADILSVLSPIMPEHAWDRQAAHLRLGGIMELEVAAGGAITGAAGASITVPRLYSAGTIRMAGGSITQIDTLENLLIQRRVLGVRDAALGGGGLGDVFGGNTQGQTSGFNENALADVDVYRGFGNTLRVTNGQLFSYIDPFPLGRNVDVNLVFTGRVALNEGLHFASGSVTDLSGTVIYNPRAPMLASGVQQRAGRLIGGGSITTARFGAATASTGYAGPIDPAGKLVAETGATINLNGASGVFDERVSQRDLAATPQWSDAGRLTIGGGALIDGATITAFGGDDGDGDTTQTRASGGVIDWVSPVIRQDRDPADRSGSALSANQIMASGFETVIARGGFTTQGDVSLELGRAFIATTTASDGTRPAQDLLVTAAAGSSARIVAPYISLASSSRRTNSQIAQATPGHLTLSAQAMDIVGAVDFNVGNRFVTTARGSVTLESIGDIRFIGTAGLPDVATGQFQPGLTGAVVSSGDLIFRAGQVYATTGTGDLQQWLEDRRAGRATSTARPYLVASSNLDGHVRFESMGGALPATPWSAGSYLAIRGANITQNGVLRAPLGLLDIGSNTATALNTTTLAPATLNLSFGADSLTSVSARTSLTGSDALSVPYGTTTDLIEYFFRPGTNSVLSTMPVGELRFAARDITISSDSEGEVRVDGRGGGDVFAYEFIPGTGGSRDVLDRLNPDAFSGNGGLQYPDGRQVFAILPANSASVALYDPVYSADYSGGGGVDLYGLQAGRTVHLDAAPGIAAGEYLLLPAHYALLPGAMRIVENVGNAAPYAGGAATLLDGSILVGGTYGTAGTDHAGSQRHSFTVQSQAVFGKYSRIETTSGSQTVQDQAEQAGVVAPLLPRDAARVVVAPLTSLRVAGAFATDAAQGGLGAQVDIGGSAIRIAAPGAQSEADTAGHVLLTTDTLANFHANSLSIGALRNHNADGTTTLDVVAQQIVVDNNVDFAAPEILLATGGPGSALRFEAAGADGPGARLLGTGALNDTRTGDYVINASANRNNPINPVDLTGTGAVVRLSSGGERLISRQGAFAQANSLFDARLEIGAGTTLGGSSIALDSSRHFAISDGAVIGAAAPGAAFDLAVSGDNLAIGGGTFSAAVEAQFGQARNLTYRTSDVLTFAAGTYAYNGLTIDAAGIGLGGAAGDVTLNANAVTLRNSSADAGACQAGGTIVCAGGSALTIDAGTITFGGGILRTHGFDGGTAGTGVTLRAANGMFVTGQGEFSTANLAGDLQVPINLLTPFIMDRTVQDLRGAGYVRPDYGFTSLGGITVAGTAGAAGPAAGSEAPGARISFRSGQPGTVIRDALVRATAGTIDVVSSGSILLQGTASLQTPGYRHTFTDGIDSTVVSAGGGVINLVTTGTGTQIDTDATTSLIVDSGLGSAGTLNISASRGQAVLRSALNTGVAAGTARDASLRLDTGSAAFDLAGFIAANGLRFQGDIAIRTGAGNLDVAQGQALVADSVSLTADGGLVTVAGTIDTSGDNMRALSPTDPRYKDARIDGGAIALFGQNGVSLSSTASLLSRTHGYGADDGRQASGGAVSIGIGVPVDGSNAALSIASGATIDVSALHPGNHLIAETVVDGLTRLEVQVQRLAPGNQGGSLLLRAPVLANNTLAIVNGGTVTGARDLAIEGYRRFDLDAIAASGQFSGITATAGGVALSADGAGSALPNFLADNAAGSVARFVRGFAVTAADGSAFTGYRLRPGVELNAAGEIRLDSAWNLGAGRIVNADGTPGYADAVAVGILVPSALGVHTSGPLAGQPRYEVVAGREAELFERFVDMTYRVGGSVRGEAPVVSLRAGGDLLIQNSITDGFFSFRDFTGADYLSYQLGGGDRVFGPALRIGCGSGAAAGCADSSTFGTGTGTVGGNSNITIALGAALQGLETTPLFANAAYNPLVNSAAASGTGDALGTMELFPLLGDGSAVHSSTVNLVGGAASASANVLQIDAASTGSVVVSGERSYQITATQGTATYGGGLQLLLTPPGGVPAYYGLDQLLNLIDSGSNAELDADFTTVLSWGDGGTGPAAEARAAALAWAGFQQNASFLGAPGNPNGVSARLRDVVAFLRDSGLADDFVNGIATQAPGFSAPALQSLPVRLRNDTATVGTTVRTGDGDISIAAATDIDLRRSAAVVTRSDPGADPGVQNQAQVGGTAVYTAGVRASDADVPGGQLARFSGYAARYVPGPNAGVPVAPVFARDGGAISLVAGRDILGRRDVWAELFGQRGSQIIGVMPVQAVLARNYAFSTTLMSPSFSEFGSNAPDQRWRYGGTSLAGPQAAIAPNFFTSGVGALSGGDVTIRAGRDLSDLTVAIDNSIATGSINGLATVVPLGGGDLSITTGRHLLGGQFDLARGRGRAQVGGDIDAAGSITTLGSFVSDSRNLLRVRVSDATFDFNARGNITFGGLGALGLGRIGNTGFETAGFFSALAGVRAQGAGDVAIIGNRPDLYIVEGVGTRLGTVLPPSLELASSHGDIRFGTGGDLNLPKVLYASRYGQLSLLAGGDIGRFALAMSDAAPSNFFGGDDRFTLGFPTTTATTSDADLRRLHNRRITHLADRLPARVIAGGDITDVVLSLPKQARIHAGGDIVDLFYQGQNVTAADVTRISAGGDITGTTAVSTSGITQGRSAVMGNSITVGGPGALFVEAGRNLGPFITSATGSARAEAGGIRTIGNEANPWLGQAGADITVLFGVGRGADYAALQDVYLNPERLGQLDGDLFAQVQDSLGVSSPDRSRFTYAPVLAEWLRVNQPDLFAAVFGANAPSGDALKTASYARYADLYAAFAGLDQLTRNRFLLNQLYFGELAAPSDPAGPSFNQYVRGYRAVQTLFPAGLGYTDNLATYDTDLSTINADHPLGVPVRRLVNGLPAMADQVITGNVDLRLSTIQSSRGGDIAIVGPGGNFVAGSVVRTSAQIDRRISALNISSEIDLSDLAAGNYLSPAGNRGRILGIPAGFEGVLSLRGGAIRGFTDGSFILNQSRLFSQAGGDITLWSSNGDLNAGQGPRSASSFPPVVLRFDPNAFSEVDSAGSVAGAGIGAFRAPGSTTESAVRLIAPVGTVDAGDAGVRATGSVFVAAARVANSDSFAAGGAVSGVPSLAAVSAPAVPASATAAAAAGAMRTSDTLGQTAQRLARIFVDILGYFGGGGGCPDGQHEEGGKCVPD